MASLNLLRKWNYYWDLLTGGGVESPFGSSLPIDEPLTLYVETTGDDNNPGGITRPLRTVDAALNLIKDREIGSFVTIKLGVGNFDGFSLTGAFKFSHGVDAQLLIDGTLVSTGITGSCIRTADTNAASILTDSGKSWTVDEHVGKIVKISSDAGATWITYPIVSNTATSLTIPSNVSGTLYEIFDYGSVINTAKSTFGRVAGTIEPIPAASSVNSNIVISQSVSGQTQNAQIAIRFLKIAASGTSTCAMTRSSSNVNFIGCLFTRSSGTSTLFSGNATQGATSFNSCSFVNNTPSSSAFFTSSSNNGNTGFIFISTCLFSTTGASNTGMNLVGTCGSMSASFRGLSSGCIITGTGSQSTAGSGLKFYSCTTAFSSSGGFSPSLAFAMYFDTCTSGIVLTRGTRLPLSSASTFTTTTTELSVDGATSTVAAMRASSPKIFPTSPNAYGTCIFE